MVGLGVAAGGDGNRVSTTLSGFVVVWGCGWVVRFARGRRFCFVPQLMYVSFAVVCALVRALLCVVLPLSSCFLSFTRALYVHTLLSLIITACVLFYWCFGDAMSTGLCFASRRLLVVFPK